MELQVLEKRDENSDHFTIILKKPENFFFYPGQYLDITLPVKGRATKPFTISSSPTENYLMITSKTGTSEFKKKLYSLKKGDVITTTYPVGTFTLDDKEKTVFIAGGVGITPFRSMIKYVFDQKLATPITLIYSNTTHDFLFKEELDNLQKKLPNLTIHYQTTGKQGRLDPKNIYNFLNTKYKIQKTIFYIAGPVLMVEEIKNILLFIGVDEINIRTDEFTGY